MNVAEVTNACRLCPTGGANLQQLISIFDEKVSKNNMKDIILVTTGVEVMENDIITSKICPRCQNITQKIFQFRQDAQKQDRRLKISESDIVSKKICQKCFKHAQKIYQIRQTAAKQDKHLKDLCVKHLDDKGIRLPNTSITMKRNVPSKLKQKLPLAESPCIKPPALDIKPFPPLLTTFSSTLKPIKGLHHSVIDIYRRYPKFKLPKKSLDRHLAPIISLPMGEVENFFKDNKLEMSKFIYRPQPRIKYKQVARKKTATPVRSVADLKNEICTLSDVVVNEADNRKQPDEFRVPVMRHSTGRRGRPGKFVKLLSVKTISAPTLSAASCDTKVVEVQSTSGTQGNVSPTSVPYCDNLKASLKVIDSRSTQLSASPVHVPLKVIETSSTHVNVSTVPTPCDDLNMIEPQSTDTSVRVSPQPHDTSLVIEASAQSTSTQVSVTSVPAHVIEASTTVPTENYDTIEIIESTNVVCNKLNDSAESIIDIKVEPSSPKPRLKRRMLLLPNATYQKMCKVYEHTVVPPSEPPVEPSPPESLSNTSKPDFIQSLGLAPAGTTVAPKSILICKICRSVHKNVTSLKTHSSRHRICPHCKVKFKSVERKQNHIDNECETRKILESEGSFVSLVRAELDKGLCEKYLDAFYDAQVLVRPEDEQIVIQDDDDDDGDDSTIIKPIIKIHNNTMLDELGDISDEKEFLSNLICLFRQKYPIFQSSQTEQPTSHDVIFEENGRCRLKDLKPLLLTYNIPVSFKNGSLNVAFQPYTPSTKKKLDLDSWNDLPLIEKHDPPPPITFLQSPQLSVSSIQVMTGTPTMSIILPNNTISIQTNNPQTTTIQPLVQNYTIPINFPVINNQMSLSPSTSRVSPKRECGAATESSPVSSRSSSDVELDASPRSRSKKVKVGMARHLRLRKVWE